jgi:hypothetical protein
MAWDVRVSHILFFSLQIISAHAEDVRLATDFEPGQEFTRCLKAYDWGLKSAEDEVAILDRDSDSGCCPAGWTPGTQPLVQQKQTLDGVFPILFLYGQITCGWRNGTFGLAAQKPVQVGAKCDYGTCYFIPQNFTCGDGQAPLLNGCCLSQNYGPHCRRGYYFEEQLAGSMLPGGVQEDDLQLHITCRQGTGPGWTEENGEEIPCQIDYAMDACYTRATEDWLQPGEFGGSLATDDDVVAGILQPWNIYGARWCPTSTTTTTIFVGINDTRIEEEFDLIPEEQEEDNRTIYNTTNTTTRTIAPTSNTTTTVYIIYNTTSVTTTTSTSSTSTTNTTTTTSGTPTSTTNTSTTRTTTTTSTNTTTTTGIPSYVEGTLSVTVDDEVSFSLSSDAQAACEELIADLAGPDVSALMVKVIQMSVKPKPIAGGGRRLLGTVNVEFEMIVSTDSLSVTLDNLARFSLTYASDFLIANLKNRGRYDLTGTLYVQEVQASEQQPSTTTTLFSSILCPPDELCTSYSCGSCSHWVSTGLECQKIWQSADVSDCVCSCFEPGNKTRVIEGLGVTDVAASRGMCFIIFIAVVTSLFIDAAAECH